MIDNTPFFIIGSGRSGTTLLRLILAGHSRLHIPPETWFVMYLVEELPLTDILSPAQVERAIAIMVEDYRWPDMNIASGDLCRWVAALKEPRLVDIINLVYQQHLEWSGKSRFGDKTPIYFKIVAELATMYPGAKFIHLIRDGRDVAISWIDLNYDRYYQESFEWTMAMNSREKFIHGPHSRQILEVRYEDLITDVEKTVRQICSFLGEAFEPDMLKWAQLRDLVPERERHIHGKLGKPLSSHAIAVWQRKLSTLECFAMESCMWVDLQRLGYKLRFSGIAWRPLLCITGYLLRSVGPLLRRGIPYLQRRNLLRRKIYI
jgi:hypothetical protein